MDNRQSRRRQKKNRDSRYAHVMQQAQKCLKDGAMRDAEIRFRNAIKADITAAEPHHMLAIMAYQAGRLEEAGNHIIEATMRADDDPAIHADCGAIMNMLGRPQESEAACRHVIDMDPDHIEAYNNLSVSLSLQDRYDEALEVCDAALDRRPEYVDTLVNKANLLVKMDDPVAGIEAFAAAIALAPENPVARVNLGAALRLVGELNAAEDQCRKGIALQSNYPEAHVGLGMVLATRGNFEGAIAAFQEALKHRPGFGLAQLNLAAARFKTGDLKAAEAAYRDIIAAHPNGAPAQTGLGIVLLADGHLETAREAFRAAVELDPSEGEAWLNLASALGSDMPLEDIAQMSELVANTRLSLEQRIAIRFALGEVADKRGEYDDAFAHFREANNDRQTAMMKLDKVYDPAAMDELAERIITLFQNTDAPADNANTSEQPVFVLGMPRAGTSLVAQIIASHPNAESRGEAASISSIVPDFPEDTRDRGVGSAGDRILALLASSALRVVDKTPFHFMHIGYILQNLPNAHIILCRRDNEDVALSCYFQNFLGEHPWANDLSNIRRFMAFHDRLVDHWRSLYADSILELHYETLIADAETECRRLINHIGLPWDDRCLSFHKARGPVLTASNWQVRQPLYDHSVGRARHYDAYLEPIRPQLDRT